MFRRAGRHERGELMKAEASALQWPVQYFRQDSLSAPARDFGTGPYPNFSRVLAISSFRQPENY